MVLKTIHNGHPDQLFIDPVATEKAAMRATPTGELKKAVQALKDVDRSTVSLLEFEALQNEARRAMWTFKTAVKRYALKNPIHFSPRANEVVLCPLLVRCYDNKRAERDNASPID